MVEGTTGEPGPSESGSHDAGSPDPSGPDPGSSGPGLGGRRLGLVRVLRLCQKELREIVRDRRTIVTLLVMPLLAYPLLSMSFHRLIFTSAVDTAGGPIQCLVGVDDEPARERLNHLLQMGQRILNRRGEGTLPPRVGRNGIERPVEAQLRIFTATDLKPAEDGSPMDLETALKTSAIDVAITMKVTARQPLVGALGRPVAMQLRQREGSPSGQAGVDFVNRRFEAINDMYVRRQLMGLGRPPLLPLELEIETLTSPEEDVSLTAFVPLILILMTITGAVYPAIDLTAGERERGTLETLMAAPVPRFGLLFAKYIAVVTIAMLTATTNLVAMTVTLMATGMGDLVFGPGGPSITLIDQVFALLMLFAAFFSAILLAITSFARSFKEAQSYLIPVMLITIAPGIMSLMPNLEMTAPLAVTPLLNIVLLARDLLEGNVNTGLATAAVLSTLFYGVAALGLAARVFGTDAILYGSQATWADLVRSPERKQDAPKLSGALFCLACLYPAYFLLANSLQRIQDASIAVRLLLTAGVTALLFVGLPLLAAVLQHTRISTTFRLRSFGLFSGLGAAILGLSLWPFAHEVFMLNELLGVESLRLDQVESAKALLESFKVTSPFVILLSLALAPAVCEEFFFRGYLLSSLRKSTSAVPAVVVSSLLFGVFHVITTTILATERMLPSTFLGLILGWICLRTGSVYPGMILHALHNGLLLMFGKYRDQLSELGWGVEERSHMPFQWLAVAAIAVCIGSSLIAFTRRGDAAPSELEPAPDP